MEGLLFFCVAYGLIETSNALYLFKKGKLNATDFIIIGCWGILIFLIAIDEFFKCRSILADIDYCLFGISWLFMIKTPCSAMIFHQKNKYGTLARKIIFIFLSLFQFLTVLLRNI